MATDNVTSIDAGKPPRPTSDAQVRRPKRAPKVDPTIELGGLTDPETFDGFTTHDLISGLHGVCVAIDSAIVDGVKFENHDDTMCGLSQAAKVLSSILNKEVHS